MRGRARSAEPPSPHYRGITVGTLRLTLPGPCISNRREKAGGGKRLPSRVVRWFAHEGATIALMLRTFRGAGRRGARRKPREER